MNEEFLKLPSWSQRFVGPVYRPRDAVHHGFEALRDEAEVGDVEREVLHEAGGHGVGVRC